MIKKGDQGFLERPVAHVPTSDLAGLFLDAAKPDSEWYVGTEIELFAFEESSLRPADHGVIAPILESMAERRGWTREFEKNGALVGLKGDGQAVSLEPGGQMEFATRPHRRLRALRREMVEYCDDLREIGTERGIGFWCLGQQPFVHLDDVPRMPKPRYEMMRAYLGQRGARALEMMHLTGSIQCTVDFLDQQNLVDKVRTSVRASPFLTALVAASPFTRGVPNGFKTVRYQIWLETDDERCGVWPEMLDGEGLTIERYIERAMGAAPMFFIRDDDFIRPARRPFRSFAQDGFEGTDVTVRDFLDHLTTFFPEVRPKGYVEMRGADCLPPRFVTAVAGFWRGILDDEATRRAVDDRLASMDYAAVRDLQPRVAREGLAATSAAGPVLEVVRELVEISYRRLENGAPDCAECLEPLRELASNGHSPADVMLREAERRSVAEALELVRV
jgi:glutamate--cysteine ligase